MGITKEPTIYDICCETFLVFEKYIRAFVDANEVDRAFQIFKAYYFILGRPVDLDDSGYQFREEKLREISQKVFSPKDAHFLWREIEEIGLIREPEWDEGGHGHFTNEEWEEWLGL